MNARILLVAALLGVGVIPAAGQTLSGETLTLDQAINIALESNRSVKNARFEFEKADDRLAALRTRRLPGIKLTGLASQPLTVLETTFEAGVFGTFSGVGPVPAENTVISSSKNVTGLVVAQVSQPLTQLYGLNLQIKQLRAGREISEAQLNTKQQTVVNDVKRAYYAILQTQGASQAAEEAIKLYRELDRVTGEYVVQQVAVKTDQMDVQTRLAKAEYEVLSVNNLLTSQKEQLNNPLGRDVRTDFTVSDGLEAVQVTMRETDLAHASERARGQRPEIPDYSQAFIFRL